MDPQAEQKVLATLYDRLFDVISYAPKPTGTPVTRDNTRLLMAKNFVLNPEDFTNALSPLNPGQKANFAAASGFSAMVDVLPEAEALEWVDTGKTLSNTYTTIARGANSTTKVDPKQQAAYQKAYDFLNAQTSIPNVDGPPSISFGPSAIAQTYNDDQTSYITAIGGYRAAQNGYNLDDPTLQRAWMAVAPGLQNTVDQAWNKWVREGKANVEKAQQLLATTINDAIRYAIEQAQTLVSDTHQMAPLTPGGQNWLLSYALPTNWMDAKSTASKITLKSSYLNKEESKEANSYSTSAKGSYGLWTASVSASRSDEKSQSHMDAQTFELSAELIQVRIVRPWYNPLLFGMKNWSVNNYSAGEISTKAMPLVPTSFVVARNVTIKADFTSEDKEHFSSKTQASASVGWGPFAVSGDYSNSKSNDKFQSKFDGGGLHLPGLQVIGFVCSKTPFSPPA